MYLLTIRDGLNTRHVGPYPSPKQAADDLDRLLPLCSERARWQIHALEDPEDLIATLQAGVSGVVRGRAGAGRFSRVA
jgi:hypothetical protein